MKRCHQSLHSAVWLFDLLFAWRPGLTREMNPFRMKFEMERKSSRTRNLRGNIFIMPQPTDMFTVPGVCTV